MQGPRSRTKLNYQPVHCAGRSAGQPAGDWAAVLPSLSRLCSSRAAGRRDTAIVTLNLPITARTIDQRPHRAGRPLSSLQQAAAGWACGNEELW